MKPSNQTLQEGSFRECLAGHGTYIGYIVLSRCLKPCDDIRELCSNLRFSNLTQSTVDAAKLQCQGNPQRTQEERTVAFLEIIKIGLVEQGTQIMAATLNSGVKWHRQTRLSNGCQRDSITDALHPQKGV